MHKEKLEKMIVAYCNDKTALDDIRKSLYSCGEYSNNCFAAIEKLQRAKYTMPQNEYKEEERKNRKFVSESYLAARYAATILNELSANIKSDRIVEAADKREMFDFCTECASEIMHKTLEASFSIEEYKKDVDAMFHKNEELIRERGERADDLSYDGIMQRFVRYIEDGEERVDTNAAEQFCAENGLVIDWKNNAIVPVSPKENEADYNREEQYPKENDDRDWDNGYDWDDER